MEKVWSIIIGAVVAAVTIGIAIKLAEWAGWFAQQTVEEAVKQAAMALGL